MERYVAYYRVPAEGQGDSGLGLEAQEKAVADYLRTRGDAKVLDHFCEVKSGAKNNREALNMAIRLCKVIDAKLLDACELCERGHD